MRAKESAAAEDGSKDAVLKVSANDKKSFCVGEAQFSAIQQKYCRDQGYISAKFKTVSKALAGRDISLTDNDFASGGVIGLR